MYQQKNPMNYVNTGIRKRFHPIAFFVVMLYLLVVALILEWIHSDFPIGRSNYNPTEGERWFITFLFLFLLLSLPLFGPFFLPFALAGLALALFEHLFFPTRTSKRDLKEMAQISFWLMLSIPIVIWNRVSDLMFGRKNFYDRRGRLNKIEYRNWDGLLHNLDGPSIVHSNGNKEWYIDGKFHGIGPVPPESWVIEKNEKLS